MTRLALHVAAGLGIGWLVLILWRSVRARSGALGGLVAAAILLRVAAALALFAISYWRLPVLQSWQTGGGFWAFAPDGAGYYQLAAETVRTGTFHTAWSSVPSAFYVDALAGWMLVVGVAPVAAAFLNLLLYLLVVSAAVWFFRPADDWRSDRTLLAAIAAYSFAPAVWLHSTQPLKDDLTAACVFAACAGLLLLQRGLHRRETIGASRATRLAGGVFVLALAVFVVAGIRWYYAFVLWGAILAATTVAPIVSRTPRMALRAAAAAVVAGVAVWTAIATGAGPGYRVFGAAAEGIVGLGTAPHQSNSDGSSSARSVKGFIGDLWGLLELRRTSFLFRGGDTSVVARVQDDVEAARTAIVDATREQRGSAWYQERYDELEALRQRGSPSDMPFEPAPGNTEERALSGVPVTAGQRLAAIAIGLALILVPVSLVAQVPGVEATGISGPVAWLGNIDSVVLLVSAGVIGAALWRQRRAPGVFPVAVFGITTAIVAAVVLGYTVTNYGSLWRLRLLVAAPLWATVLALAPERSRNASPAMWPNDDDQSTPEQGDAV